MKTNTAKKIEQVQQTKGPKKTISGTQFKAVQLAVSKAIGPGIPETTQTAVTQSTVYGLAIGERKELLLRVESEQIVDARHVELKLVDGAGRRYIWNGTTGEAARLQVGNMVLLKGTAEKMTKTGMVIKHCRVLEVGT